MVALQRMIYASFFAALMCVGSYISVPIGPVPIVLNNFFVLLAGLLLGARWGALSVLVYLLVGVIGLPVFAGGKSGLAHLLGPTGGYLVGFVAAAWLTGVISQRGRHVRRPQLYDIAAVLAGSIVVYCIGVPWLHWTTQMSWVKTLMIGCTPFIVGDAVKAAVAVVIAGRLRSFIRIHHVPSAQEG